MQHRVTAAPVIEGVHVEHAHTKQAQWLPILPRPMRSLHRSVRVILRARVQCMCACLCMRACQGILASGWNGRRVDFPHLSLTHAAGAYSCLTRKEQDNAELPGTCGLLLTPACCLVVCCPGTEAAVPGYEAQRYTRQAPLKGPEEEEEEALGEYDMKVLDGA